MRTTSLIHVGVAAILCATTCSSWANEAGHTDQPRSSGITQALERRLSYEVYWWDSRDYKQGVPLSFKLLITGNEFYALIEGLTIRADGERWTALYVGADGGPRALVIKNFGFPQAQFQERLDTLDLGDVAREFSAGDARDETLTIPTDCTPRYDPPTPEKQHMLDAVVRTMQREVTVYSPPRTPAELGNPKTVTFIIGDFNVDYPWVYVFVEQPEAVYELALHDPDGRDEAAYQSRSEYLYRTIESKSERDRLIPKIRAQGITRTIVLRDAAGKPGAPESTSEPPAGAARSDSEVMGWGT
jgi:hypothetical protein